MYWASWKVLTKTSDRPASQNARSRVENDRNASSRPDVTGIPPRRHKKASSHLGSPAQLSIKDGAAGEIDACALVPISHRPDHGQRQQLIISAITAVRHWQTAVCLETCQDGSTVTDLRRGLSRLSLFTPSISSFKRSVTAPYRQTAAHLPLRVISCPSASMRMKLRYGYGIPARIEAAPRASRDAMTRESLRCFRNTARLCSTADGIKTLCTGLLSFMLS